MVASSQENRDDKDQLEHVDGVFRSRLTAAVIAAI
jgi:hypothetical protein